MKQADIFVSYARADDESMSEGARGWVTGFADHLQKALGMQPGGGDIKLWIDHRLAPEKSLDQELPRRVGQAACFVAVMSPRYLESGWCPRELGWYIDGQGGGTGERIFLIESLPTDRTRWHRAIQGLVPQPFWDLPFEARAPKTLGWPVPDPKSEKDRLYWDRLRELAHAIAERVRSLDASQPEPARLRAWIAAPTDDLQPRWDDLAGALRQQGCDVLPVDDVILARNEVDFRSALQARLAHADFAVQLLGACPGRRPDWATAPLAYLQHHAAREAATSSSQLPCLTWRSPDVRLDEVADADHSALLTGVVASGFEDFRQQVLEQAATLLARRSAPPPAAPSRGPAAPLTICVSADRADQELGHRVTHMLAGLGTEALLTPEPEAGLTPATWRKHYEDVLADSDALMVVYGQAPAIWAQSRLLAARKALGAQRSGTWTALLDAPPPEKQPIGIHMANLALLDCRQGLAPEPLLGFVNQLRAGSSGRAQRV